MTDPRTPTSSTAQRIQRLWQLAPLLAVAVGVIARLTVLAWSQPWTPHHPDEHILPREALALWEGVTPREVGWPASTTRVAISVVEAAHWFVGQGRLVWQERAHLDVALRSISTWISRQDAASVPLYEVGRAVSLICGVLQLLALVWALRRWTSAIGTALGVLAVALGPVPVLYSQYVLADVAGLLAATILLGLAAEAGTRRVIAMGAWAGVAASSKFHFGLWILTPLAAIWISSLRWSAQIRLSLAVLAVAAATVLLFVPWLWIDPVLGLKEVLAVVVVKVVDRGVATTAFGNLVTVVGGLGSLTWIGALLGLFAVRADWRRYVSVLIPTVLGAVALAMSGVVFDRYGLVLLPGLALLAGVGWAKWSADARAPVRWVAIAGFVGATALTVTALVAAERTAGEADVDVLAQEWVLSHVARGQRVAVWDESNAVLPRTRQQLLACADFVNSRAAYEQKWRVEGVFWPGDTNPAMSAAILTDERFAAYWCERELDTQDDAGFFVVKYHDSPRFGAVLERDVVDSFRSRTSGIAAAADVLVIARPVDAGVPPAAVLRTERGQRLIYVR